MLMKRIFILSLLSLVIVSCARQQTIATIVPTNIFPSITTNTIQPTSTSTPTLTSTPEATATGVSISNGLIMVSPNRYRFLIWPLSFSLPDSWDINDNTHLSSADVGRETYSFYRDDMLVIDSINTTPKINIRFATIPVEIDIKTYSEETLANWHGDYMLDLIVIDSDELGLNLNKTIVYKTHFKLEDIEYTQYIIHAIYQTMGIEIIMYSITDAFESIEPEFLYFLKSLSFG